MGATAIVGLAALVAGCDELPDVVAHCVDSKNRYVDDRHCDRDSDTGVFVSNGQTYRYYYGGPTNTRVGQPATGGSTAIPQGANLVKPNGNVVRGGLGAKASGGGS